MKIYSPNVEKQKSTNLSGSFRREDEEEEKIQKLDNEYAR